MNYFTSDTHFSSQRTLELSRRPFTDISKMDKTLISNWNNKVSDSSFVMHLGDFGNYEIVKQLSGKVILVCGNYEMTDLKNMFNGDKDKFREYLLNLGFYKVHFNPVLYNNKSTLKDVWMCHEPSKHNKDKFNLFGHIHRLCMVKRFGLNVGTDCHNFTPISEEDVLFFKNGIENFYDDEVFN